MFRRVGLVILDDANEVAYRISFIVLDGVQDTEWASNTWLTSESVGCTSITMKASYASTNFAVISDGVVMIVAATSGRKLPY